MKEVDIEIKLANALATLTDEELSLFESMNPELMKMMIEDDSSEDE